jgi:hypothetical protein
MSLSGKPPNRLVTITTLPSPHCVGSRAVSWLAVHTLSSTSSTFLSFTHSCSFQLSTSGSDVPSTLVAPSPLNAVAR